MVINIIGKTTKSHEHKQIQC